MNHPEIAGAIVVIVLLFLGMIVSGVREWRAKRRPIRSKNSVVKQILRKADSANAEPPRPISTVQKSANI